MPLWLDTLDATLRHVTEHPQVDPNRIALVGISLGAFLSMCWAAMQSAKTEARTTPIRCIVELSGGLPEPYALQATSRLPPTLLLHGLQDTVVPVQQAHELAALLKRLGVQHETHILKGEGHWFSPAAQ